MKKVEKNIVISDLLYKSLHDKLSEDEQTMLDCWLINEENRKFYEEIQEPEVLFGDIIEIAEVDTALYYRKVQRTLRHTSKLRLWYSIAAGAAAMIPLAWAMWPEGNFRQKTETPYVMVQQLSDDQTTLKTGTGDLYLIDNSVKQLEEEDIRLGNMAVTKVVDANMPIKGEVKYNVLATSSRGNIEVTLSDSSRVWLNAGSSLRYPNKFTDGQRIVELNGEAYFEVTHNAEKPFIVKTAETDIEVLGTQFNVNTNGRRICTTTLVEGCVKIRNRQQDSVIIYPGQQVEAPSHGPMTIKTVDPRYYTAWRKNRFAFEDKALWQIMEELSTWYNVTFEFSDTRLANMHFTTIVPRYPEISDVLIILQMTQSFSFNQFENDHIRITGYME